MTTRQSRTFFNYFRIKIGYLCFLKYHLHTTFSYELIFYNSEYYYDISTEFM
jgi:hypothetical protein